MMPIVRKFNPAEIEELKRNREALWYLMHREEGEDEPILDVLKALQNAVILMSEKIEA